MITKRTIGAAIALALITGPLMSCQSLPSSKQTRLAYRTTNAPLPTQLHWVKIGVAHELINANRKVVVISGGDHPITDKQWEAYSPPLPWRKNIERHLLFSETAFLHSPDAEMGAKVVEKISGYTWVQLAKPVAVDFIPAGEKTDLLKPACGHLVLKVIKKAQVLKWSGPFIYQLSDGKGNDFVMHATQDSSGPNLRVLLPKGWTLKRIAIDKPLIIAPFGSGDQGFYNIVGDCLGQGYHQYRYANQFYPGHGLQ